MNEEMRVEVNNSQETDTSVDYISAINEIKANTVSKEAFAKVKAENKKLLETLVNGQELSQEQAAPRPSVQELRTKLFDDSQKSNLEYVTTALELRQALMDKGERDPFLPYGDKVEVTSTMYQDAEDVAAVLQECVDFADGDSGVFTARLQAKLMDSAIPNKKRR